ncbi:MAG TPA: Lrp/AsnC family transcriptional regulator [Longimicrobiaceae bacterium]|nr:Lrp/AsnC family transcriptional regulator [Longimicrobiaceae bacterium]
MIDETDHRILELLQENARVANAEIARQLGMAPSAILERIRKLEERGVIEGYQARIRPEALGLTLSAFVFVRADERAGAVTTAQRLAEIPEVQEVHHVAGEDCFLVKVRTTGTRALGTLLRDGFGEIDTIRSTRSTIVLETIKESFRLNRPAEAPDAS